jgi:hypothetical protein
MGFAASAAPPRGLDAAKPHQRANTSHRAKTGALDCLAYDDALAEKRCRVFVLAKDEQRETMGRQGRA